MNDDMNALLKRAFLFLEDGEFQRADEYCERALDQDPENAMAYLGKAMAELQIRTQAELPAHAEELRSNRNYQKALRYRSLRPDAPPKKSRAGLIVGLILGVLALAALGVLLLVKVALPAYRYSEAKSLMDDGMYEEAIDAFEAMNGYRDSDELIRRCRRNLKDQAYDAAVALYESGKYEKAISAFEKLDGYEDSDQYLEKCRQEKDYADALALWEQNRFSEAAALFKALGDFRDSQKYVREYWAKTAGAGAIAGGWMHTIALRTDGTVVSTPVRNSFGYAAGQDNVSSWSNIVAVAACWKHSVGLRADGTVVTAGSNEYGEANVYDWRDIVAIAAGSGVTAGLKADGSIVSTSSFDMPSDSGYVAVAAYYSVFGVKGDGTVEANTQIYSGISAWRDIIAVSVGSAHVVGLKSNGTVVAIDAFKFYSADDCGQCNVSGWTDIVAIAAGNEHTVGLRKDGTVVAVGNNADGQCNVSSWRDIVAIAAGYDHTIGLRRDGTVVVTGEQYYGQGDVAGWRNIRVP